ncbi:MAG TPA: type IV pilus biogenesis/stability protein PilW [Methylotenera sp.]|nr:type IV pilus biogenesis/stability protein PilW [Methylotenera sp.]HPH04774.1 type IV pilus biogenesis/stability protein PilW [Methylotenera sp.]HPN01217.1 type IV pilus biogenesis/stability protein PilW [Methylotenera sp.]
MNLIKLFSLATLALFIAGCASTESKEKQAEYTKSRARAHTDLGAVYFQQKQYEIALEEFGLATKIDPNYALAFNGLGLVNAELGKDSDADSNFKKAVQIDPNNSESQNNYGTFLCSRSRFDESIPHFLAAVKNPLYATPAIAYTNAGVCSARKNDMANAEVYFNKALQIDPLMNTAAYQLANIQFQRKQTTIAKKTLQNALLTRPGPEILWLGIQIERELGGQDEEASYALQLRSLYPDSAQAKLLQSGK